MKAYYEWTIASRAVSNLVAEAYAAQRHLAHRKRVNILNDLCAIEAEIVKIREALSSVPSSPAGR